MSKHRKRSRWGLPNKERTRRGSGNFLQRVLEQTIARVIAEYIRDLLNGWFML